MITIPMTVSMPDTTVPMSVSVSQAGVPVGVDTEINTTVIEANFPPGGSTGDLLAKHSDSDFDVEWITPANSAEQDNTRPITSAAVYMEIGNINALLATI